MSEPENGDVKIQLAVGEQRFKVLEEKVGGLEDKVEDLRVDVQDTVRKMDSIETSMDSLTSKMDDKIFDEDDGLLVKCSSTKAQFNERFSWLRGIFVAILLLVLGIVAGDIYQNSQNATMVSKITSMYSEATDLLGEVSSKQSKVKGP